MNEVPTKLGLVLSGGGAKGAYEAGVVRALGSLGIEPEVISGASIGALNGAIVAGAPTMSDAADRLETLWLGLNQDKVLKLNLRPRTYLALAGLHLALSRAALVAGLPTMALVHQLGKYLTPEEKKTLALYDSSPIQDIMREACPVEELLGERVRDLWVALYPSAVLEESLHGVAADAIRYFASKGESEFVRLRNYPPGEVHDVLLASAAIPLIFAPVRLGDRLYRDGGMGGRISSQGNTPATPLAEAGCTHLIVVMLSDDCLWNRYEWPTLTALEIRPTEPLESRGLIKSMLDFNPETIRTLMEQGERDTLRCLARVTSTLQAVEGYRKSVSNLQAARDRLEEGDHGFDDLAERMRRLDG